MQKCIKKKIEYVAIKRIEKSAMAKVIGISVLLSLSDLYIVVELRPSRKFKFYTSSVTLILSNFMTGTKLEVVFISFLSTVLVVIWRKY